MLFYVVVYNSLPLVFKNVLFCFDNVTIQKNFLFSLCGQYFVLYKTKHEGKETAICSAILLPFPTPGVK
jgi:hypothetical protein